MEAIRKAGKSLKDLSDCQLIVVAQNLLDGGRFILDIIAKLDEELTRMVCQNPSTVL